MKLLKTFMRSKWFMTLEKKNNKFWSSICRYRGCNQWKRRRIYWNCITRYILLRKSNITAALLYKHHKFRRAGRKLPEDNDYAAHFSSVLRQRSCSNSLNLKQECAPLIGEQPPMHMDKTGCLRRTIWHKSWPHRQSNDPSTTTEAQKALALLADKTKIPKAWRNIKATKQKPISENPIANLPWSSPGQQAEVFS